MKKQFSKGILVIALLVCGIQSVWVTAVPTDSTITQNTQKNTDSIDSVSLAIAETLDVLIRVSREQYTKDVVVKLEKEGAGASVDYPLQQGHVPVPEQLLGAVADQLNLDQAQRQNHLFSFVHRSRWYLNPANNLKDNYEKEGWSFLINQQENQQKLGKSLKGIKWKPFVRVETTPTEQILRFMSPVVASEASCVNCHNKWEQVEEIKTIRELRGVTPGKIFKTDELLGAVSITVPLATVPVPLTPVPAPLTTPASHTSDEPTPMETTTAETKI